MYRTELNPSPGGAPTLARALPAGGGDAPVPGQVASATYLIPERPSWLLVRVWPPDAELGNVHCMRGAGKARVKELVISFTSSPLTVE